METDYFPRLSGVNNLKFTFNQTVNRQVEVTLLLISPLLSFFLLFLPQLILSLYSNKFLPALDMAQVLTLAMYMRAVRLPVEYIPLAKGDSRSYLLLESAYDVVLVVLVIIGFRQWGNTRCRCWNSTDGILTLRPCLCLCPSSLCLSHVDGGSVLCFPAANIGYPCLLLCAF